jgi:hypothetical protein
MTKLDIISPWTRDQTRPQRDRAMGSDRQIHRCCLGRDGTRKAFSIMLGRIQQELRYAYGANNARKVLQAIMDTTK